MSALADMQKYIGIPFEWGGASLDGAYCWGLMVLVQREVFGRAIPLFPHSDAEAFAKADGTEEWCHAAVPSKPILLGEAEAGDILMMWETPARETKHVGTFADKTHVLHTTEGTGSIMERTTRVGFQWRPIQAYRPL